MLEDSTQLPLDPVDQAISRRLARLSTMPVDISGLSRAMKAQIPPSTPQRLRFIAPLRAIAASLLLAGAVAIVAMTLWTRPAMASSQQLLELHQSLICSMDANDSTPDCCTREIANRPVTCRRMRVDGAAVSLMIADA